MPSPAFRFNADIVRFSGTPFFTGNGSTASASLIDRHGNAISSVKLKKVNAIHRTDWQGRQLLYSASRTNLAENSQTIGGTGYTNNALTATENAGVAPDGTTTLALLSAGNGNTRQATANAITVTASTVYTVSCYLMEGTAAQSAIAAYSTSGTPIARLNINWTSGVPSTNSSSGASNIAYTAIGSGLYRISFSFNTSTFTAIYTYLYPSNNNATASTVYAWGMQVEIGTVSKPYIKTVSTAVSITDYSLSGPIVNFSPAPLSAAVCDWDGVSQR